MASEQKIVVFSVGDGKYGAEITSVKEIVPMQRITTVPDAPRNVDGITSLRGRIMPVLSLARCLGLPESEIGQATRIIVVEEAESLVGCIVDSVTEVLTITADMIEPLPDSLSSCSRNLEGIVKVGEDLVALLNLAGTVRVA